jgi:predicted nucleic acid-binding protein
MIVADTNLLVYLYVCGQRTAQAEAISHDAERRMGGAEFSVVSQHVLQLAIRSRCSAYDCEFVALAQDLRVPFVTADRQVLAAFPSTAVSPGEFVA